MNKQQKIDKIRQFCIAANESILDLAFGCKIKTRWHIDAVILGYCKTKSTKSEKWYLYQYGKSTVSRLAEGAILEIIGRDIGLADVLLAIPVVVHIENPLNVTDCIEIDAGGDRICYWNLKDFLSDQLEPTITFIYDLFK